MATSLTDSTSQVNLASYGTGNPFSVGSGVSIVTIQSGQGAIYGDASKAWTLSNAGTVGGAVGGSVAGDQGASGSAGGTGLAGGFGVDVTGTLALTNSGEIAGGRGGGSGRYQYYGGSGGVGVSIGGAGSITNMAGASIAGAAGSYGYMQGGAGASGVVIDGFGTVTNQAGALIAGGAGGNSGFADFIGVSGEGIVLVSGGRVTNAGTILGGAPGHSRGQAYSGGAGVQFLGSADSTLTNSGTISGDGEDVIAVQFSAGNDRLILYAGSELGGADGGAGRNVVELAAGGASVGTVDGLGTDITNFQTVVVDTGAHWTATGTTAFSGGSTLAVRGSLAVADATASGAVNVSASGTMTIGGQDMLTLTGTTRIAGVVVSKNGNLTLGGGTTAVTDTGTLSVAELALSSGGALSVGGTLSHAGVVTEAAGSKITVGSGANFAITRRAQLSGTTAGTGILTFAGSVATINGDGTFTVARMDLSDRAAVTVKTDLTYAGTLSVVAGTKLTVGATETLRLTGTAGGSGAINIGAQATLVSKGTVGAAETVAFTAKTGELQIANTAGFNAGIAGFAAGDRIDIDNTAFKFGTGETLTFVENAAKTGGTLVLKNGDNRLALHFFGQYVAQGFDLATDGHGGTLITYPPPAIDAANHLATGGHG